MAYEVRTKTVGGREIYTLTDGGAGASASVVPSFGFNLFDLRLPVDGTVRPVLFAAPGWEENPSNPGRNGIPVLFPFPNRIRGGRFEFEGKTYQLPQNHGTNAIHGFAIQAPWDVVEQKADETGAFLTGRFQISKQAPEMLPNWPADAVLEIRYGLSHGRLSLEALVRNPSTDNPLPYGFGIHPYFRLPFEPCGDESQTKIILPATEYWVLEDFLPTGERRPVNDRLDFRKGKPIKGLKLDDVLTGLPGEEGHACRLVDENLGTELQIQIDRNFRELVVFTPPGDPGVIAVEPYTQTTDAINLQAQGIDAGLRVLAPGASQTLLIVIQTQRHPR